jgi:putative peptidoglycan lipid II flippase
VFNGVLVATVVTLLALETAPTPGAAAALSVAMVGAGVAQLVCVGAAWMRTDERPRRLALGSSPAVRRFLVQAIPGVVAGGIPQLKLMAGAMVASSSQAAVSWLYYANRLYELPLGVISIAISSVMVPAIAASLRSGDGADDAASQSRALELALALSLPSAVAFAVLADPIAGGLFQRGAFGPRDTAMVAAALAAISAGLPGHSLEKVLGAVSFAHEDTHTPMYAALCGLGTAIVGSVLLFPLYGHVGIAGAIALSGWVGAILLGSILWRRDWLNIEPAAWRRAIRIVAATAIMGAVIGAGDLTLNAMFDVAGSQLARIATLFVLVAVGLVVYFGALQAFGVTSVMVLARAVGLRF